MTKGSQKHIEVSLIGDFDQVVPDDVILVREDKEYVKACVELSKSHHSSSGSNIWVRSRNHYAWLQDFTEQIGVTCEFNEKTARLILADRWNVSVPEWVDDETVLAQGLLDIKVEKATPTSFWIRILSQLLDTVFESATIGAKNLSEIISTIVRDTNSAVFERYPILHRCLQERCSEWADGTVDGWVKDVCERLPNDAQDTWVQLSVWSVLHSYPTKVLEYVLAPHQLKFVQSVPSAAVEELPVASSARDQVLTQIRLFFEGIKPEVTSSEAFQKVLECTSGRLLEEFKQIVSLLKANQFEPLQEDIEKVQEKFQSCPGVSATQLNALAYLVRPKKPKLAEQERYWTDKDWIQWTVDEYLPYRAWQVHAGNYDADLEETVKRFSEWYVSEYVSIHKNPQDSLILSLNELAKNWDESLVIILIVDCLPIPFMDLIEHAMRESGFSRHERTFRFSALPTVTEHNKPQLLSGQWSINKKAYDVILRERAEKDWHGREVMYVSNLKALSEVEIPSTPATVVLNFIDGDELLHEDAEAQNTTHEEELGRIYTRMAEAVRKTADAWGGSPDDFHVHVVTDHGACRILEEEKKSFDSKVVNKLFPEEKYRFATISEDKADEIPQNLWNLGFRFKPPFGTSDNIYFIPKGHNTVRLGGKKGGYTHGGATPEEVIVPVGLYKPVKAAWNFPSWRFIGLELEKETGRAKFFIQRVISLELEIQNPNTTDIRVLRASILSPDTDLKGCLNPVVPAGGEAVMTLDCYFRKAALEQPRLEIEVAYEIAGDTHTILVSVESHFKSAVSTGFSLKDL